MSASNDPFADPPQRPPATSGSRADLASHDPTANEERKPNVVTSPCSDRDPMSTSVTPSKHASQRINVAPLTDGIAHDRTPSSDPHAIELSNSRTSYPHGRTLSSDPLALENGNASNHHHKSPSGDKSPLYQSRDSPTAVAASSGSGSGTQAQGSKPVGAEDKKKSSGWSFFKSSEEKLKDNLKAEQSTARKSIDAEEEKDFKQLRHLFSEATAKIAAAHKHLVKLSTELEEEWAKGFADIKKERKAELGTLQSDFKAQTKEASKRK